MYEVKTLLPQFDIDLPNCMYSVKNVALAADACGGTTADANASPDVATVKSRQERLFEQLEQLKQQMAEIRKTLGVCQKGPQHTQGIEASQTTKSTKNLQATQEKSKTSNGGLREEPLHDIVINGHPNLIPYGLLALKNAWKDLFTIDVKTFTHSTMPDIGPEARAFEKQLKDIQVNPTKPKLSVTLIWKNCEHTEMISSPTMYVPIYGEVNVIRYLGRVGPEEFRYENSVKCNEIDAVLDICYQLLRATTPKSKTAMIHALSNRLQKQKYFSGDQISIADIGVYSSFKRMKNFPDKDLTPSLKAWRKRVQTVTLI